MMEDAEKEVKRVSGHDEGGPLHQPRGRIQPRGRGMEHSVSFLICTMHKERRPHAL